MGKWLMVQKWPYDKFRWMFLFQTNFFFQQLKSFVNIGKKHISLEVWRIVQEEHGSSVPFSFSLLNVSVPFCFIHSFYINGTSGCVYVA